MDEVAHRCDDKVLGELGTHSAHVTPEKILAPKLRGAWKMIRFLVLIQMLDFVRSNIARPLHIKEVGVI